MYFPAAFPAVTLRFFRRSAVFSRPDRFLKVICSEVFIKKDACSTMGETRKKALFMRVEVFYRDRKADGRADRVRGRLAQLISPRISGTALIDVYLLDKIGGLSRNAVSRVFLDPAAEELLIDCEAAEERLGSWDYLIEISYKSGVTDPVALTARQALELELGRRLEADAVVLTARQYVISLQKHEAGAEGAGLSDGEIEDLKAALYNPLIQQEIFISRSGWEEGSRPPRLYPTVSLPSAPEPERIDLSALGDEALDELSRQRLLSLSTAEMQAVRAYYADPAVGEERTRQGIGAEAVDVELEMIAQTWSEHCKHKIFAAGIDYRDSSGGEVRDTRIDSLFSTFIKKTTDEVSELKGYTRSVFHDNSGVVDFDEDHVVCFKAETHNSPSALDPYGGAITGIVGVNRDILGTGKGARPIFNTNVLCFGKLDAAPHEVPKGLLHPRRILEGVHRGIIDGGNQSGIPTAAGAFLFDESYTGKPLVYCGTGGIMPRTVRGEESWIKHIDAGDKAVMIGGRIGKDGIHGATFSSAALDEASPTSAVQIGDPITQKRMSDFLMEARDRGLYKGITDNGAGGLSSSFGEMAEYSGGVRLELDNCPLKYQGLAAWEIFLSESQERMSLSVSADTLNDFLDLARRRGVEAAVIGEFTDSGFIEILHRGRCVCFMRLSFVHEGLPKMRLRAEWSGPGRGEWGRRTAGTPYADELKRIFLSVLSDPDNASKETLIRQYDHEVQASSVIKPCTGAAADAPSDGAVLKPLYDSFRGLTVTHGICPRYGDWDTYHMAAAAVDEAFRAHIALGGDPEEASVLDNFCWPDPVESEGTPDGAYKLAQLVRACMGLRDACRAYGLPLISGKDSMKNDARIGGKKVSVRPTLLVSLMGIIPDVRGAVSTDFKRAGDLIYAAGRSRGELGGGIYERVSGADCGPSPCPRPREALPLYRALAACMRDGLIASCHDLSDGGIASAAFESALGGRCGFQADLELMPREAQPADGPIAGDGRVNGTAGPAVSGSAGGENPAADSDEALLFGESASRFLISVAVEDAAAFEKRFEAAYREACASAREDGSAGRDDGGPGSEDAGPRKTDGAGGHIAAAGTGMPRRADGGAGPRGAGMPPLARIGRVNAEQELVFLRGSRELVRCPLGEAEAAWKSLTADGRQEDRGGRNGGREKR